jgi:two-component system, LuxR family, sensor kinase FixL
MRVLGSLELVDTIVQAIAMIEVDMTSGIINWASPALERMFSYSLPGDLEGQKVEVLIPESLRKRHAEVHRPTFADSPHQRMMGSKLSLMGQKQDGSSFPVEVMLMPRAVNRIKVVVCIVFDMTDRQRGGVGGSA